MPDRPALLDDAIAAHGGLDRWRQLDRLTLDLEIGGNILALKGCSPRLRRLQVEVDPHHVRAVLTPFPRDGQRGVFERDRLRIEMDDGTLVAERAIVRDAGGAVPRRLLWRHLDLLYFLGYALWNYSVTPFLFTWPGFACREGSPWRPGDGPGSPKRLRREGGSIWRTLHVRYPPDVPTHCRDQVFYFDERHVLRRLDYTADVFGSFARGAHLCDDVRRFDGIVIPTHRVVHPRRRNGQPVRLLRVMEGRVHGLIAQPAPSPSST